jgi:hypothetical protein
MTAGPMNVLRLLMLAWLLGPALVHALPDCGAGADKSGAFCYPACRPGFSGVGPVCWGACPAGYANDGATCRRDVSIIGANNDRCPVYDKCGLTFSKGCSTCPPGYKNDGCTCRRDVSIVARASYGRGAGFLLRRDYHGIFERYIRDHRNIWLPSASPLSPGEKAYLVRFFPQRLVDQVKVYDMAGMTGAFNFKAAATTYGSDFIAVRKGHRTLALLKHEFVHVCQYDKYGQEGFARLYADQFVDNGYNEQQSPLERQAYAYAGMNDGATPRIRTFLGYCE